MNQHLIFMDIDGTLVNNDYVVSQKTIETIKKYQKEGHIFYISTGRMLVSARQVAKSISPETLEVASNGSIFEIGDTIHTASLSTNALTEIYHQSIDKKAPVFFFTSKDVFYTLTLPSYFNNNDQQRLAVQDKTQHIQIKNLDDLLTHQGQIINAILIMDENPKILQSIKTELETSQDISLSSSSSNNIEITAKNVNKAYAIHHLKNFYHIPTDRIISFGDGQNDIEMFQNSGVSVAMKNASDEVKKYADYVTESNINDGIAVFLNKYFK